MRPLLQPVCCLCTPIDNHLYDNHVKTSSKINWLQQNKNHLVYTKAVFFRTSHYAAGVSGKNFRILKSALELHFSISNYKIFFWFTNFFLLLRLPSYVIRIFYGMIYYILGLWSEIEKHGSDITSSPGLYAEIAYKEMNPTKGLNQRTMYSWKFCNI